MWPTTISKVLSHVALHHRMKTFTKLHQLLHVLIRTHIVSSRALCHQEWISAWNSNQQPRFVLIKKFFQHFLVAWLQTVPSTSFEHGQIHHNFRITFGIDHDVLHEFFIHQAVLNQVFIHRDLLVTFPNFPTLLVRHDLRMTFPDLAREGVETCQIPN